mgnify:CR=1 FL=1
MFNFNFLLRNFLILLDIFIDGLPLTSFDISISLKFILFLNPISANVFHVFMFNPYPSSLDFNHAIRNADFNAPFWHYVFFHEVAHLHPENRQVKDQTECEFDADRRALEIYADLFPDGPDIRPLVLAFRAASSYADNPNYSYGCL